VPTPAGSTAIAGGAGAGGGVAVKEKGKLLKIYKNKGKRAKHQVEYCR